MVIKFKKKATKALEQMDRPTKQRIKEAILGLIQTPPQGDIKLMRGFNDGRMRLRVGQYRVIYRYDNDGTVEVLLILDIGARGDIYK